MEQEIIFKKELNALLSLGRKQGNTVSKEQVSEAFPNSGIDESKLSFIYEYLEQNKILVEEEFDPDKYMSSEDKEYLAIFFEEIEQLKEYNNAEKEILIHKAENVEKDAQNQLLEVYLNQVIEIAKLYLGQGVLIEDLIGEGNVAIALAVSMLSCVDSIKEADGFIIKMIMDAMEVLVGNELDAKEVDEKIVEKVNYVALVAENLYKDVRRKITVEEIVAE